MNSLSRYIVFRTSEHLPSASIGIQEFCSIHEKNSVIGGFKESAIFIFAFLKRLFVLCLKRYVLICENLCAVLHHHGPELNYFVFLILASDCKYSWRDFSGCYISD